MTLSAFAKICQYVTYVIKDDIMMYDIGIYRHLFYGFLVGYFQHLPTQKMSRRLLPFIWLWLPSLALAKDLAMVGLGTAGIKEADRHGGPYTCSPQCHGRQILQEKKNCMYMYIKGPDNPTCVALVL